MLRSLHRPETQPWTIKLSWRAPQSSAAVPSQEKQTLAVCCRVHRECPAMNCNYQIAYPICLISNGSRSLTEKCRTLYFRNLEELSWGNFLPRLARVKYGFSPRLRKVLEPNFHQATDARVRNSLQMIMREPSTSKAMGHARIDGRVNESTGAMASAYRSPITISLSTSFPDQQTTSVDQPCTKPLVHFVLVVNPPS